MSPVGSGRWCQVRQGGGFLFRLNKMSQNSIDDVLVLNTHALDTLRPIRDGCWQSYPVVDTVEISKILS